MADEKKQESADKKEEKATKKTSYKKKKKEAPLLTYHEYVKQHCIPRKPVPNHFSKPPKTKEDWDSLVK